MKGLPRTGMSDDQRNALNAMLFHTGTQSKDFVLVLATNRPGAMGGRAFPPLLVDCPRMRKKSILQGRSLTLIRFFDSDQKQIEKTYRYQI